MTDLGDAIRDAQARGEVATVLYQALRNQGEVGRHRVLSYRCPERCLVLDLVDTPEGLLMAVPRYKTSPAVTAATSSESGRRKNTEDGEKHWKGHATFVSSAAGDQALACDHLNQVLLRGEAIEEDLGAGRAEVTVRRDGTRFGVR